MKKPRIINAIVWVSLTIVFLVLSVRAWNETPSLPGSIAIGAVWSTCEMAFLWWIFDCIIKRITK